MLGLPVMSMARSLHCLEEDSSLQSLRVAEYGRSDGLMS